MQFHMQRGQIISHTHRHKHSQKHPQTHRVGVRGALLGADSATMPVCWPVAPNGRVATPALFTCNSILQYGFISPCEGGENRLFSFVVPQ